LSVSRLRSTEIGLELNGGRVGAGEADTHVLKLLRHAGHRARVLFESGRAGRRSPWGSSERVGAALLAARGGAGVVADAFAAKSLHKGVLVGIRGAPSDEVVVDGLNDGVSRERAIRRPDGRPELRGEEGIERGTRGVPLRRTQGSKAGPKAKGRLVTPLGTMPLHVDNVAGVNEEEVQDVEELHDALVATLGKRAKLGVLRLNRRNLKRGVDELSENHASRLVVVTLDHRIVDILTGDLVDEGGTGDDELVVALDEIDVLQKRRNRARGHLHVGLHLGRASNAALPGGTHAERGDRKLGASRDRFPATSNEVREPLGSEVGAHERRDLDLVGRP